MAESWLHPLSFLLSGAFIAKLYEEYRNWRRAAKETRDVIDQHLNPVLKAGDELVGKLRSLAQEDFSEFRDIPPNDTRPTGSVDVMNFLFLFAQFWARIQILRMQTIDAKMGATDQGRALKNFFDSLESKGVRLVDRARQRGMGESLISTGANALTFFEFAERFGSEDTLRKWFTPLIEILDQIGNPDIRQSFLIYGVVLHAMIDHLDPKHLTTHERPGWGNKLTKKSRNKLKYRVFQVYLPFTREVAKYLP